MSKKKKRRGGKVGSCLVCGNRMRRHDPACKRCGQRSPLFQPKASRPYLVKGAKVTPIRARRCWNGCPVNKSSAKYCVGCGEQLGISQGEHLLHVQKSADPYGATFWGREAMRESDPERREQLLSLARQEPTYRGNDPAFLAKSMGYRSLDEAATYETDPARSEFFRRAHLNINPFGGAA